MGSIVFRVPKARDAAENLKVVSILLRISGAPMAVVDRAVGTPTKAGHTFARTDNFHLADHQIGECSASLQKLWVRVWWFLSMVVYVLLSWAFPNSQNRNLGR